MVKGIPIFKIILSEGLFNQDVDSDKLFAYAIEANKGPVESPEYIASNDEAKRIFGVDFAPHFYQGGSGVVLYRVGFKGACAPSITYKAYCEDYASTVTEANRKSIDVLKVTATSVGTPQHKINLSPSLTSTTAYNLTVTIDGVGSKKYQNISSLTNVVKRINSKFADYLYAELLVDEDQLLGKTNGLTEAKYLKIDGNSYTVVDEAPATGDYSKGIFKPSRVHYETVNGTVQDTLSGGSNGYLLTLDPKVRSNTEIPASGLPSDANISGATDSPSIETTLLYAYRSAFEVLENVDVLGVATLSNSEIVQNELIEHINKLIEPEVAKYRFGVTGFLNYPGTDRQGRINPANDNISIDTLAEQTVHIDNPFIIYIGQGVVFEDDGVKYNLLPHEAVQLYTGLRSKLDYNQSIFGGNPSKLLSGVTDVLPLTTDGADIYKEDRETLNEAGITTFLNKFGVTFLQGVTTSQEDVVLSHESIMSIVVYVLRRLVEVAWPFMGEDLTEDIKSGFTQALSDTLKNIMETDNSLMALEDYNIAPYDVEIRTITTAGFNEAGKLIRKNQILAVVKIVPRGAIDAIELSVVVI